MVKLSKRIMLLMETQHKQACTKSDMSCILSILTDCKIIMEISVWSILTDCKYRFNNREGTHEL